MNIGLSAELAFGQKEKLCQPHLCLKPQPFGLSIIQL
jgi:hypothetical protein